MFQEISSKDENMDSEQIVLVQSTWESVLQISETATELLYKRLFETDLSASALFAEVDMKEQGRLLINMIDTAVKGLNHLDTIVPAVQELGKRHVRLRARPYRPEPRRGLRVRVPDPWHTDGIGPEVCPSCVRCGRGELALCHYGPRPRHDRSPQEE